MTRTYWQQLPDGTLVFLGAFPAGHVARDPKSPQGQGRIIDVTDLDVRGVHERLQVETRPAPPRLENAPTAIAKRFQARMPVELPWAQVEGFVK